MARKFADLGFDALEVRELLSRATESALLADRAVKPPPHAISGTLSGGFGYFEFINPPVGQSSGSVSYGVSFQFEGKLNGLKMDGFAEFESSGASYSGYPDFYIGNATKNLNPGHSTVLGLDLVDPPFSPSSTVPASYEFVARVVTAKGAFKGRAGQMVGIYVSMTTLNVGHMGVDTGAQGTCSATFKTASP